MKFVWISTVCGVLFLSACPDNVQNDGTKTTSGTTGDGRALRASPTKTAQTDPASMEEGSPCPCRSSEFICREKAYNFFHSDSIEMILFSGADQPVCLNKNRPECPKTKDGMPDPNQLPKPIHDQLHSDKDSAYLCYIKPSMES